MGIHVSPDQKTVFGIQHQNNPRVIQKENIVDRQCPIVSFTGPEFCAFSVQMFPEIDCFVAVEDNDSRGKVTQICLSSGKVIKEYTNLGIGKIFTAKRIKNLCFLGGNNFLIRVIDVFSRSLILGPFKTSIGDILSIQICPVTTESHKIFLGITGRFLDFSNDKTDLFEITKFVEKYKFDAKKI